MAQRRADDRQSTSGTTCPIWSMGRCRTVLGICPSRRAGAARWGSGPSTSTRWSGHLLLGLVFIVLFGRAAQQSDGRRTRWTAELRRDDHRLHRRHRPAASSTTRTPDRADGADDLRLGVLHEPDGPAAGGLDSEASPAPWGFTHMKVVPTTDPNITLGMALSGVRPGHLLQRQVARASADSSVSWRFIRFRKFLAPFNFVLEGVTLLAKPLSLGLAAVRQHVRRAR